MEVLEKVVKKENERVVFAIKYHPFLPSIANVMRKHWNTMVKEPRLKEIFPSPPMVAFKQHPNLQRQLCHAKLPGSNNSRTLPGMKKCLDCTACSYINVTNECTSKKTGEIIEMTGSFTLLTISNSMKKSRDQF